MDRSSTFDCSEDAEKLNDTRYIPTTTPHEAMLRDRTQAFVTNEHKGMEKLYYMMMYDRGIGSMTEEEKAKARARVFLNGLDKRTEEDKAKARALGFLNGLGKRTEEDKAKDVGKKRGALRAEHRAKISKARKGYVNSAEHKAKISKARKGCVFSDEHKVKMSKARKGCVFSDEHKAKMSKARKGKKRGAYIIK